MQPYKTVSCRNPAGSKVPLPVDVVEGDERRARWDPRPIGNCGRLLRPIQKSLDLAPWPVPFAFWFLNLILAFAIYFLLSCFGKYKWHLSRWEIGTRYPIWTITKWVPHWVPFPLFKWPRGFFSRLPEVNHWVERSWRLD